jgi:hypothetical protein
LENLRNPKVFRIQLDRLDVILYIQIKDGPNQLSEGVKSLETGDRSCGIQRCE